MIPLATLKLALRVSHDTDDNYILELEERAVARVMGPAYADSGVIEEVVTGGGGSALWLSHPASAITTVVSREYAGGDETAIAADDAEGFELRGSALYRGGGAVWDSDLEYVVTYTPAAPAEAAQAVESLVVLWYERRLPDAERLEAERAILSNCYWLLSV